MKYMKYFEEIELSARNKPFNKISDKRYEFTTDELTYIVDFIPSFIKQYKSCWSRQYDLKTNREIEFHQSNKNPYNILSTVTEITENFLKEKNVEVLIITHTLMNSEECPIDKLNKRARVNYQYLKSIDGYQIRYFNQELFSGNGSVSTNCIMFKPGIDINPIIETWNKFRPHFEVILT